MMNIRGLYKFTLVDYPKHIACIIFTGGCNFRCPYCHNAALVLDPASQPRVTETEFFNFLSERKGLLDGVVISGGEPTFQVDLPEFCAKIKNMGFKIKLDTNSSNPQVIKDIHRSVKIDALGIDVKAPSQRYAELTCCSDSAIYEKVTEVIRFAIENDIEADLRTTVHKVLLSPENLKEMAEELSALGVKLWSLQQFNPVEMIDDALPKIATYSDAELLEIARLNSNSTMKIQVRGLNGQVTV